MVILRGEDVTVRGVASVTLTMNVKGPATVGLPEITPVVGSRVNPKGNVPLDTAHM
jgi:hypothetical protein